MKTILQCAAVAGLVLLIASCSGSGKKEVKTEKPKELTEMEKKVAEYAEVTLSVDLSHLSDRDRQMISKLMDVADIMDELFWLDAIGDKNEFLSQIKDSATRRFAEINYGPWDRLDGNKAFVDGYGEKPAGANYYPADITDEEFEAWKNKDKLDWYSLVRRDEKGNLMLVKYHEAYAVQIEKAASLLEEAAELCDNAGFKKYLLLRAEALRTDEYLMSDLAWMEMKNNPVDFVVGPIESYEDGFKGARAAHSGQILVKDIEWSKNIERFNAVLPELQAGLPVPPEYKKEKPAAGGDMNVYDVVYYGGDCNSGSKNIAINLPNDPRVHATKGSRKLQLKNAMQAKFDKILVPIANLLIEDAQLKHIKFEEAFFQNVMFHEVAHGLGVKYTLKGHKSIREVLEAYYSPIEEAKADIAGLYMVTQLYEKGEFPGKDLMDNYVTFLAGIFRSVRFGVSSSHGKANMIEFYYLKEKGAFVRNPDTGKYSVDFEKMKQAVSDLVHDIIIIQGNGDKATAEKWVTENGSIGEELQKDLDRIAGEGIAKDIVFKQGKSVLGL